MADNLNKADCESYREYLAAMLDERPEYQSLHDYLADDSHEWSKQSDAPRTQLVSVDLSSLSTVMHVFGNSNDERDTAPEVLKTSLTDVSSDLLFRMIFISPRKDVASEVIDTLGMTLDVDPAFFLLACGMSADDGLKRPGQCLIVQPFVYMQVFTVRKDASTWVPVGMFGC